MRRILLILFAFLVLCGFVVYDSGIVDRWYFIDSLTSSSGTDVSITSATPPAIMIATPESETEPFFVTPSANESLVGPYGLYVPPAVDNLVPRGSFETCSGGHPTGWSVQETDGDVSCSTTHKAKGANSVLFTADAGVGYAGIFTDCIEVDKTKDYIVKLHAHGNAYDENFSIEILQYSGADCSGFLAALGCGSNVDLAAGWEERSCTISATGGGAPSWNGSTQSLLYKTYINQPGAGAEAYVDEASLVQSSYDQDSSCTCDSAVTCSCSTIIASISTMATAGTWQIEGVVQSPIDGAEAATRYIFYIPGTVGSQNKMQLYWSSDVLTLDVWTSGGVQKTATVAAAGDADAQYAVKAYHTATGRIGVCWAGSCGTEATGAITVTPSGTTYLGNQSVTGSNIWIDDIAWSRRLTEPIGTP